MTGCHLSGHSICSSISGTVQDVQEANPPPPPRHGDSRVHRMVEKPPPSPCRDRDTLSSGMGHKARARARVNALLPSATEGNSGIQPPTTL